MTSQEFPRLTKPPIQEALIDIQVKVPNGFDVDGFLELDQAFHSSLPLREEVVDQSLQIGFGESPEPTFEAKKRRVGFQWRNSTSDRFVWAKMQGFTINQLHPYAGWESFVEDAKSYWSSYCDVARPIEISRVAIRYINRINFADRLNDVSEHFNTGPVLSTSNGKLPVRDFATRLQIPYEGNRATAMINMLSVAPPDGFASSVVLDIDVFQIESLPQGIVEIWPVLEGLREIKNSIFFGSLKEHLIQEYR